MISVVFSTSSIAVSGFSTPPIVAFNLLSANDKLKKYDERKPGFFASLVKDRDEYLDYLQTAVLDAASEGDCILIGRGSFAILEDLPNLVSFPRLFHDSE